MYRQESKVLVVEIILDAYSLSKKRKEIVTGSQIYGLGKCKYCSKSRYTATIDCSEEGSQSVVFIVFYEGNIVI